MPRQVESGIARRFGSRSANPRAVRAYSSDAGWVELPEPKLLTYAVAHELRQAGYTMVEARWRRHVRQLTLSSLVPRRHSHHSSDTGAPDAAASEPLQSAAHPASTGSSKNAEPSRNPGSSRNAGSSKGARRPPRRRRRGRAIAWWITACVVAVLIACTGWIAVRALMAKSQLEASVSLVSTIKTDVAKGDVSAARTSSAELSKKAESSPDRIAAPNFRGPSKTAASSACMRNSVAFSFAWVAGSAARSAFCPSRSSSSNMAIE